MITTLTGSINDTERITLPSQKYRTQNTEGRVQANVMLHNAHLKWGYQLNLICAVSAKTNICVYMCLKYTHIQVYGQGAHFEL